jgi:hypothetical protein
MSKLSALFAILSVVFSGLPTTAAAETDKPIQWQPPSVHLDTYTGKPTHTFSFSGSGFVPGEQVDVYLEARPTSRFFGTSRSRPNFDQQIGLEGRSRHGDFSAATLGAHTPDPLLTISADARGEITGRDTLIPLVSPGDYSLGFVGRNSHTPVSVGFNVQGFNPWAVLDNYYMAPQVGVGFEGQDFVPGEVVQVYLNTRLSQPIAQVTADADGRFAVKNAFSLPDLTGNNQLIFVGQQSQTEVTATFAAAIPTPTTP